MTGHYMKPAQEGKLYPCKKCNKTPTAGQDRYYEQITGQNGSQVWIGCVDFECFKTQGGSSEPAQQKKSFTSTKFPITDALKIYNLSEELMLLFLSKRKNDNLSMEQQAQFIESMFKTLSGSYKP